MKVAYNNPRVVDELNEALPSVRKAFFKQIRYLAADLHHPSLRAKKYDEMRGLWQARVNKNWRFYFVIENDTYLILDVIPHPK